MKKLSKLLALVAGFATLFFIGCSDLNDQGTVSNEITDKTSNAKEYTISFAAPDGTNLELSSLGINSDTISSRTIVADAIDLNGSDIHFYVWGKNEVSADSIDPTEVTFVPDEDSKTTGTVVLDFPSSKYYFVLACTQTTVTASGSTSLEEAIKAKAVYIGYANVDLRNSDAIKFYISSNGLEGTGGFNLTLVADDSWTAEHLAKVGQTTNYTIKAAPYNRTTGEIIDSSANHTVGNADFVDSSKGDNYNISGLTPGSYSFVVSFKDLNGAKKTYEYSDIIIILPNQTVTKKIEIPDVIEYRPDAPALLKVAYIEPEDNNLDEYNALLEWEDMATNEKYFEIKFYDVTNQPASKITTDMQTAFEALKTKETTLVTTKAAFAAAQTDSAKKAAYETAVSEYETALVAAKTKWEAAIAGVNSNLVYTYNTEFYGNSNQGWVAGSLQRNNEHVVIRLTLGKKYLFSVAAVNDAGKSNYTYATYSSDISWTDDDDFNVSSVPYTGTKYATKKAVAAGTPSFTTSNPYNKTTDLPSGVTKVYTSAANASSNTEPIENLDNLTAETEYFYVTTAGYENATSLTANLYRLVYHLYTGTYVSSGSDSTTDDIVEYLCQGDIDLKCPCKPIGGTEYPQLYNIANKRWTSWKDSGIAGTDHGTKTTVTESGVKFTYYDPGDYSGNDNLDLYASYSLTDAAVVAYNDADYDLVDIAAGSVQYDPVSLTAANTAPGTGEYYTDNHGTNKITDWTGTEYIVGYTVYEKKEVTNATPIISIDAQTGITKSTNKYYTVKSSLAAINFTYNGTLYGSGVANGYSSLKAIVTRAGATVASGLFNASKKFQLTVNTLPLGVYTVNVIAEYQGRQYTYPIVISVEDL